MLFRSLSEKKRKILRTAYFVIWDIFASAFGAFIPIVMRFGIFTIDKTYLGFIISTFVLDTAILIGANVLFKLYNRVWSYASIPELNSCVLSATATECIYIAYKSILGYGMPKTFYLGNWIVIIMVLCFSRVSIRLIRRLSIKQGKKENKKNIMIVGAGSAGNLLIKELQYGKGNNEPVCVIDDNPNKLKGRINGVPIVGNRNNIPEMVFKYSVDEIIIAIPSASPAEIKELIELARATGKKVKKLPEIASTLTGSIASTIREVNYEDLLAREPVIIARPELSDFVKDKTIMVTGGGGSIGSELVRQLIANKPKELLVVDIYENSAYELEREINTYYPDANFRTIIASVREYDRMEEIFKEYHPEVIYHAAAHKHVPLMETSPNEAIKNNCMGTLNMVKLADKYKAERFVLISTDKAVRPTSVMGATKRVCEMIIQTWNKKSETEFVAVRFGNVLGSNGSAIPLFLKQIEHGGPVTVTHREITRFFMTIPEAVSLVLTAGLMAKGGEIFILDMGEPVKIYDLACELIREQGYIPEKDIRIDIVGLRPGEKLYEEVLMAEEGLQDTENKRIKIGRPISLDDNFEDKLDKLINKACKNEEDIRESLKDICPTYAPVIIWGGGRSKAEE